MSDKKRGFVALSDDCEDCKDARNLQIGVYLCIMGGTVALLGCQRHVERTVAVLSDAIACDPWDISTPITYVEGPA